MKIASTLFCLLTLCFSCAHPGKLTGDYQGNSVRFGKSGGFTNIPMEYVLHDDRHVYEIVADSTIFVNRISRKQMKDIEELLDSVDFKNLKMTETGNMTYFMHAKFKSWENKVQWTDISENEQLKNIYKKLLSTIND